MSQQTQARQEIEAALVAKAQAEPAFRQALLKNATAAIEKEFGIKLPAGSELKVVEETASTNYLVLPAARDGVLSDADLDAVAGGTINSFFSAILPRLVVRAPTTKTPDGPATPTTTNDGEFKKAQQPSGGAP